jgi:iron complex outermembrane recepter protein
MHRLLWAFSALIFPVVLRAEPQTNTNVITAAEDAFGMILGPESIGLYNPGSVRGFSPLLAGNVRINGLYFDQQGAMIDRLVDRTQIRVGLSAMDFPWPAPTGIVDYTLRQLKDTSGLTSIVYAGPYGSSQADVDGYRTFWTGSAGIAAGASYRRDVDVPGLTAKITSIGILPQWTPSKNVDVRAFWSRRSVTDQKTQPSFYLDVGQRAPEVPRRYFGQEWAGNDSFSEHYGILAIAMLNKHWSVSAGLFRSVYELPRGFGDVYVNTSSARVGDHLLIAERDQDYGSTSGEVRLSYAAMGKSWRQEFDVGVRARSVGARYGGSDAVDLGIGSAGEVKPVETPDFHFGPRTADRIREYTLEASYNVHANKYVAFTFGAQRPNYSRDVTDPVLGDSTTAVSPWLYNASFALRPIKQLVLFSTLSRGLEDSGLAPVEALNSGAVLGAVRSSQEEVGIKYALSSSLALIAAGFDIQKPYFALDEHRVFADLGRERHRGVEISLAGEVVSGLSIVAGATLLSPHVTADSAMEPIGTKAVGQPARVAQLSVDYRLPYFHSLSLNSSFTAVGSRMVRVDNRAEVPGYSTIDVGARYQMNFGHHLMTLRLQVLNVTNSYNWYVGTDGSLAAVEPRRAFGYVVANF